MAINPTNSHPYHGGVPSNGHKGFRRAAGLAGLLMMTGLIAQNITVLLSGSGLPYMWSTVAGFMIFAVFAATFYKPLYRVVDGPHFTVTCLLSIALGTALGTFITQSVTPEVFTERYGLTGSKVLRFLQLDDVFHSWWYVTLFSVLALSLLKISAKKKPSLENIGFHLAHLSPIVILLGFWVDYFYGFRGIIQLEEGQSKNTVQVFDGHTNRVTGSTELPFSIRLDKFSFEKHAPDYRLQIWRIDQQAHAQEVAHHEMQPPAQPEIIASLPLDLMKTHRIYGTDIRFRLKEFYPDFYFEYTYPLVVDTIEAIDPGIQLALKTDFGDAAIQLRAKQAGRNKIADASIIGAWLEFYWDLPAEVLAGLKGSPAHKKTDLVNRVIFAGSERKIYFLLDGQLNEVPMENNRFYPIPGKEGAGFTILHVFPDAAYLQANPASKSSELRNPVARVEIFDKGWETTKEAYLYPGNEERRSGNFVIPGSSYFLALESFKDRETKFYKSELTVLDKNGDVARRQSVKVNEPMLHRGYRFYQTDYDPKRPTYSGIGVSHEPGLYVIYAGFILMVAGVAQLFYGRKRLNGDGL